MRQQATLEGLIAYARDLSSDIKYVTSVDAARAILYEDTRVDDEHVVVSYNLGPGQATLTHLIFSHPGILTPVCQLQSDILGVGINYAEYRHTEDFGLDDEETTQWIYYLRNLSSTASVAFDVVYGVRSNATGTLTATVVA